MHDVATAPRRPRVVLLHASAGSSRQWRALAERLAPQADVQAIDLQGHGTRPPWRGPGRLTLADELALVMPLLAGGAHLVGHSYGGAVALAAALAEPAAVRSLVVYEPVAFPLLLADPASLREACEIRRLANAVTAHVLAADSAAAAQRFVDFWADAAAWDGLPPPVRDGIAARMAGVARQFDALFGAADFGTPFDRPFDRPFDTLRMPTLVLTGQHTVAPTRRLGQLLRRQLPQAVHETLPGMGHMGPVTHADAVNRRLERFLAEAAGMPARRPLALAAA